jgi:hypothetical protein
MGQNVSRLLGVVLVCGAAGQLHAAPVKIAVTTLAAGEGVSPGAAGPLTSVVVGELRKAPGTQLITQQDIANLLNLEQQKQMLGCQTDQCRADLGNALGVDRLLTGNISKLGESWLLQLTLLDVANAKVVSQVDRRQKGGSVDDLLDAIPAMVKQLLAGQTKNDQAAVGASAPAPVTAATTPTHGLDLAASPADVPKGLKLLTDGKGTYFAYLPGQTRTLYFGDGKTLREAYVTGGSKNGAAMSIGFWEPRVGLDRYKAGLDIKPEGAQLNCGDTKVPLPAVADAQAATLLKGARFLAPRWRRSVYALLRDDLGNYYLVDHQRGAVGKDMRLYVGKKKNMKPAVLEDAVAEDKGALLISPTGRLKITHAQGQEKATAVWLEGQASTPLTWLEPEVNLPLIYGELSAYQTEPLGTPCDGRF